MRANCGATERVEAIAADLRTPCARPVAELSLSLSLSLSEQCCSSASTVTAHHTRSPLGFAIQLQAGANPLKYHVMWYSINKGV